MIIWEKPEPAVASMAIPYEPGVIEAICYTEGKEPQKATLKTIGHAQAVEIIPEQYSFKADHRDLAFFEVMITDHEGNRVPNAGMEVFCTITGGELLGIYSGNPRNEDDYTSNACHVFEGRALAVVRTQNPGNVSITVCSEGLAGATCTIYAE